MVRKLIDITGERYGRLTVIKEIERNRYTRRWLCRCDCGNEVPVTMSNLRNGHTTSCGCAQRERTSEANLDDMTGKRFGKLTVIRRGETDKQRHVHWICRCDCGEETSVDALNLRNGTTKSCGCLREENGVVMQTYNEENLRIDGVMTPTLKRKARRDNETGIKGVSIRRKKDGSEVYRATIRVKGKTYYLGEYATIEAATAARRAGEQRYHAPYIEALGEWKNNDDKR
ncbi:AP2 domain-containing protein [Paenibacillus dakarensis]|uniref:AP2 domain-containing protein n=1 Tax=Paenibacillus dakarensis TaxID=1527293 RepID=UPI0006D56AE3|nr:AP2 domain-containing protein [Paenibacillus dakarensis]